MKITDELNRKQELLKNKVDKEKLDIVEPVKQIFTYMLFFDNVRKVENFKTFDSIREVIKKLLEYCEQALGINANNYFNAGILLMNLKKFREDNFYDLASTLKTESVIKVEDRAFASGVNSNIYDNIIKYPYQEIVCYKKIGIIIELFTLYFDIFFMFSPLNIILL